MALVKFNKPLDHYANGDITSVSDKELERLEAYCDEHAVDFNEAIELIDEDVKPKKAETPEDVQAKNGRKSQDTTGADVTPQTEEQKKAAAEAAEKKLADEKEAKEKADAAYKAAEDAKKEKTDVTSTDDQKTPEITSDEVKKSEVTTDEQKAVAKAAKDAAKAEKAKAAAAKNDPNAKK